MTRSAYRAMRLREIVELMALAIRPRDEYDRRVLIALIRLYLPPYNCGYGAR